MLRLQMKIDNNNVMYEDVSTSFSCSSSFHVELVQEFIQYKPEIIDYLTIPAFTASNIVNHIDHIDRSSHGACSLWDSRHWMQNVECFC